MSELIYQIHYKMRKKINKFLFQYLYRSKYPDVNMKVLQNLNYSKAYLNWSKIGPVQGLLSKSDLLSSNSTVIDVGGETGKWSGKIFDQYKANLLIFEPHPESVKILKELFTDNKVRIFEYGLSSRNQVVKLSKMGMASSIYEVSPGYNESNKFEIKIRDIKDIFSELSLGEIDLIKINIEGGEYDLVPRMIETEIINRCKIVRIQFHDWFPNSFSLRKKIVKQLAKTHDIEWNYPMVWESWIRKDIARNKK